MKKLSHKFKKKPKKKSIQSVWDSENIFYQDTNISRISKLIYTNLFLFKSFQDLFVIIQVIYV